VAARRLSSAFHSSAVDNFLATVVEVDMTERWKAVALALMGEVSALADQTLGPDAQDWLDHRLTSILDRRTRSE
jgi:hypothetical protein